jgi:hypothetical protein
VSQPPAPDTVLLHASSQLIERDTFTVALTSVIPPRILDYPPRRALRERNGRRPGRFRMVKTSGQIIGATT